MYIINEHFTGAILRQIEAPKSAVFYFSVGCSPADDGVKAGNMKKILLTRGEFSLVDSDDFERINRFKWYVRPHCNTKYAEKKIRKEDGKQTSLSMHRFILNPPDNTLIDHINGNGLDNRKGNLRLCTNAQNMHNQFTVWGVSKFKGVHREGGKWCAYIKISGKGTYLGSFTDEEDAAKAYDVAALKHRGDFARTNKMMGLLPPVKID